MIKVAMSRRHLQATDVARAVGVSKMTVSYWRRGASGISESNLLALSAFLGIPIHELRTESVERDEHAYLVLCGLAKGLTNGRVDRMARFTPDTIALFVMEALDRMAGADSD